MDDRIDLEEVKIQLRCLPGSSAPGPDKITYGDWKNIDRNGTLLTSIFEICRVNARIPHSWRRSTTILIHKRGDESNIRNWRPISLQNTLYKIYAAVISRRLAQWAVADNILSPSQKGFLPFEGCAEHNFLLQSALSD